MACDKYYFVLSFILFCHKLEFSKSSVNIALKKTTSQSTSWTNYPSSKAVDGYRDCAMGFTHTEENKQSAWWQVDLGDLYEIKTFYIYYRDLYLRRLNGYTVSIISSFEPIQKWECFKDEDPNILPSNLTPSHVCPHLGRYVNMSVERLPGIIYKAYDNKGAIVNLCEFEVYGCPKGYYGNKNCDSECGKGCLYTRCDPDNGKCNCLDGWEGDTCETHKCDDGYYGNTCTPCSSKCAKNICRKHNGHCNHGCQDSMYGDFCNKSCPAYCKNNRCDQRTGYCSGDCQSLFFLGRKCNECDDGYYGNTCTACPSKCAKNICSKHNGHCNHGCEDTMYGDFCNKSCPAYCKKNKCDQRTGYCSEGCQSRSFLGRKCNVCVNGFYGKDCNTECPVNCKHGLCDATDGTCILGCRHANMTGDKCYDKVCDGGLYGTNCDKHCPVNCKNGICDGLDGSCLFGCRHTSMTGDKCDDTIVTTEDHVVHTNIYIGIIISGVVSLINIVFIAILLLFWKRWICPKMKEDVYDNPTTLDSTQQDNRNLEEEQQQPVEYETLDLDYSYSMDTDSAKIYMGIILPKTNL